MDNLRAFSYFLDLALQNIKGEIDYSELERRLTEAMAEIVMKKLRTFLSLNVRYRLVQNWNGMMIRV